MKIVAKEPTKVSPARAREAEIQAMSPEELLEHALKLSRYLGEAKMHLRVSAKSFRSLQKPTYAQDIEKFLDNAK